MKTITIIGFGNQAKAWALNLRDSGYEVTIGLRTNSSSSQLVKDKSFKILDLDRAKNICSPIALLIPDSEQLSFLNNYNKTIETESRIIYAHGYSVTKDLTAKLHPEFSHLLLAPKGIATEVRTQYLAEGKLGAAYSLEHSQNSEKDKTFLFDLAKNIGITAGPYETSFEMETFADLLSEQALLCSVIPHSALTAYNSLRSKGVSKEIAYLECWYELKLIVDTMVKMGPDIFFNLISPNALIGGEKAKNLIFDKSYNHKIDKLQKDIFSGDFFKEITNTDIEITRNKVNKFWKNQELTAVHQELKNDLFN